MLNNAVKLTITGRSDLKVHSKNLSHQAEYPCGKKQGPYKIDIVGAVPTVIYSVSIDVSTPTQDKGNK